MTRTTLALWRDAVRDSRASRTAKLVAFVLSTYMNAVGHAWPGKETLATGCSLSDRAVDRGVNELEGLGLLRVARTRGGNNRPNHYSAAGYGSDSRTGKQSALSRERHAAKGESGSQEGLESVERGAPTPAGAGLCALCGVGGGNHVADCVAIRAESQ